MLAPIPGAWEPATVTGTLLPEGWGAAAGYPGIVLDEHGADVAGFLFSSDALAEHWPRLDAFEGDGYERVLTDRDAHGRHSRGGLRVRARRQPTRRASAWSNGRMSRRAPLAVLAGVLAIAAGCDRPMSPAAPTPSPTPTPTPAPAAQFATAGDPESDGGATWTLRGPVDGTVVDLRAS